MTSSPYRCLTAPVFGENSSITAEDPTVLNSTRLVVHILRISFSAWRYILHIPLEWSVNFLQYWTWTLCRFCPLPLKGFAPPQFRALIAVASMPCSVRGEFEHNWWKPYCFQVQPHVDILGFSFISTTLHTLLCCLHARCSLVAAAVAINHKGRVKIPPWDTLETQTFSRVIVVTEIDLCGRK